MLKFTALILTALLLGAAAPVSPPAGNIAVFAGGCFWCMESEFEDLKGIFGVVSGYTGGEGARPTYEQVSTGNTGFIESVAVTYDPAVVTYQQLLDIFWSNVDPFDAEGQFCDKGSQYVAAIFTNTPEEETLAKASLAKIEEKAGKKVATKILPRTTFYEAEEHHQDYADKNKVRYSLYRKNCGRDARLKELGD